MPAEMSTANVEQYFSRAGMLSDPNMDPHYLGMLVMVGANKKRFAPSVQAIKERYYQKFRGKSGESLDESLDATALFMALLSSLASFAS